MTTKKDVQREEAEDDTITEIEEVLPATQLHKHTSYQQVFYMNNQGTPGNGRGNLLV